MIQSQENCLSKIAVLPTSDGEEITAASLIMSFSDKLCYLLNLLLVIDQEFLFGYTEEKLPIAIAAGSFFISFHFLNLLLIATPINPRRKQGQFYLMTKLVKRCFC